MNRSSHSAGKRQREAEKARKKQEKAERRRRNRETSGDGGIPIASLEDLQPAAMREPASAESPEAAPVRGSGPPSRLFVGSLSWDTTSEELKAFFAVCGDVVDAVIVKDRATGQSRGFGFVTMADRKAAAKAVRELDGQELDGRPIRVDVATDRQR